MIFEKVLQKNLLIITLFSHLMIAMEKKKKSLISPLISPKSQDEKSQQHTIRTSGNRQS